MGIFHGRVCGGHDVDERALMARIAYTPREPVVVPPRRPLSPAAKRRVLDRYDGHCAADGCMETEGLEFDHIDARAISARDDEANYWPLCGSHHSEKTNRRDKPRIAKTKRQAKMSLDVPRRAPRMKSGETKWPKRKMSRPNQGAQQ